MFSTVVAYGLGRGWSMWPRLKNFGAAADHIQGVFFMGKSGKTTGKSSKTMGILYIYIYNVRPPSYKLVYNPHEYYTYKYDKP